MARVVGAAQRGHRTRGMHVHTYQKNRSAIIITIYFFTLRRDVNARTHTRTHTRTLARTHTHSNTHTHVRTRTRTHTRARAHTHTHVRTRIHARTHTHIYMYTHGLTASSGISAARAPNTWYAYQKSRSAIIMTTVF